MPIDTFTVLLFGLLIKLVLGALFVVFWLKNRAAPWFGWWSASLLLGGVTSVLYMWRGTEGLISVGLGNTALIASFACCWQGARALWSRLTQVSGGGADAYNSALVQFNLARCAKQVNDVRQAREAVVASYAALLGSLR